MNTSRFSFGAMASLVLAFSAGAATETVDGITWTYTVSGGEASIFKGYDTAAIPTSTKGAIAIPAILGDCHVTSIGDWAFEGCSGLTDIWMPKSFENDTADMGIPSGCSVHFNHTVKLTLAECLDAPGLEFETEGGDYEAAANATAANGRPVWECYVADLDPADPDDNLVAGIEMVDGKPVVSILKGESPNRSYTVEGAPEPTGPWGEATDESRFFRIRVALP